MIFPLFRRSARPGTISALYGAIVAQARSPLFYTHYGISDSVEGRFELIVLHLVLVLRRIGAKGAAAPERGPSLGPGSAVGQHITALEGLAKAAGQRKRERHDQRMRRQSPVSSMPPIAPHIGILPCVPAAPAVPPKSANEH